MISWTHPLNVYAGGCRARYQARENTSLSEGNRTHTHPQYPVSLFYSSQCVLLVSSSVLLIIVIFRACFSVAPLSLFLARSSESRSSTTLQNTTTGAARQTDSKELFERFRPSYCRIRAFHSNARRRWHNGFESKEKISLRPFLVLYLIRLFLSV